ncbi:hypothetical protein AOLI_G00032780 [Acnodon oligacanthus]
MSKEGGGVESPLPCHRRGGAKIRERRTSESVELGVGVRMRREKHRERERKEKTAPVSRALSWLSGKSLSRRTRKLFQSHNDLSTLSHPGQEEDDDDWLYEPQHYIVLRRVNTSFFKSVFQY